jgi:predicted nucleic acid-binding protein
MILLDTGVISAALRRRRRGPLEERLTARVRALLESDFAVALPGIVFQEVLSGIGEEAQHRRLLAAIRDSFPIFLATEGDHLRAASRPTATSTISMLWPGSKSFMASGRRHRADRQAG